MRIPFLFFLGVKNCLVFGRGPNRVTEISFFFLHQSCNRHVIRANVNKPSDESMSASRNTRTSRGEGGVAPRKSVIQSTCQYDVTSRVIKMSTLSRKYFSDFLHLEILRSLLSQKTRLKDFFCNETSSGVMNFKESFLSSRKFYGQSFRLVLMF